MRIAKVTASHPALQGARVTGTNVVLVELLSHKTRRGLGRVDIQGLHSNRLANRPVGRPRVRRFGRRTA